MIDPGQFEGSEKVTVQLKPKITAWSLGKHWRTATKPWQNCRQHTINKVYWYRAAQYRRPLLQLHRTSLHFAVRWQIMSLPAILYPSFIQSWNYTQSFITFEQKGSSSTAECDGRVAMRDTIVLPLHWLFAHYLTLALALMVVECFRLLKFKSGSIWHPVNNIVVACCCCYYCLPVLYHDDKRIAMMMVMIIRHKI